MSATGPFANILSERAALLAEVAGAVATVVRGEPDDGLELEEEVKVADGELVEVPEVTETVEGGIEELPTEVDVLEAVATDVLETVATDVVEAEVAVGSGENVMGPGPSLNRRINK